MNIRSIRGGWKKVFHREFDNRDCDNMILALENSEPSNLQNSRAVVKLHNESWVKRQERYMLFMWKGWRNTAPARSLLWTAKAFVMCCLIIWKRICQGKIFWSGYNRITGNPSGITIR